MVVLEVIGNFIWNPWLLSLFLLSGLYLTVRSGFFQVAYLPKWLKMTLGTMLSGKKKEKQGGLTQFQALATALASTIGTGSIAGVATAIFYGGAGAVFWMWVSAFFSMMIGCVEKTLAVHYREPNPHRGWQGGPMCYMERGVGSRPLAMCFSLCCVAASLGGGNMVQANSIATTLSSTFGWEPLAIGIAVALVTGLIMVGGIGRIGKVSERLVPCMALLFLLSGGVVLICNRDEIPSALQSILWSAFHPSAVLGGGAGYSVGNAMRYGIARGVFTNEAGMGSSAMAHAAANVEHPAEEGMWGIFEVFVSTLLVCTVTALVILTTGVYDEGTALRSIASGQIPMELLGAPLSAAAFSTVLGGMGGVMVSVCLLLFAFTSLLGWSYYGERGLSYLIGSNRGCWGYRTLFLLAIIIGSVGELSAVWQLADIFNGLMALPNLIALLYLAPEALRILDNWMKTDTKTMHKIDKR